MCPLGDVVFTIGLIFPQEIAPHLRTTLKLLWTCQNLYVDIVPQTPCYSIRSHNFIIGRKNRVVDSSMANNKCFVDKVFKHCERSFEINWK